MTDQDLPLGLDGGPERPPNVTHVVMPIIDDLSFTRREDGGYDPDEVDTFLKDLQTMIDAADNERTALRADVAALRDRLEERGHKEIAVDAVGLLSQAQLIADKAIADAETYARDLVLAARAQYRIVLERAEESAKRAADQAALAPAAPAQGTFPPVPEIEYVRTYARVAQVQLRAVLDALAEQIDLLGEVPKGPIEVARDHGGAVYGDEDAPRSDAADDDVEWVRTSD
jgi:DivIVA domain-containing protein